MMTGGLIAAGGLVWGGSKLYGKIPQVKASRRAAAHKKFLENEHEKNPDVLKARQTRLKESTDAALLKAHNPLMFHGERHRSNLPIHTPVTSKGVLMETAQAKGSGSVNSQPRSYS